MNLIFTFFAFALFFRHIAAAQSANPLNNDNPSEKHLLKVVPYISVEEICQDRVILDFELWYESWIVHSVQKNNDMPGHVLDEKLHSRVNTHIEQVKNYLAQLEEAKKKFSVFPPLHTDIKISKLNKDINHVLQNPMPNKFEDAQEQLKQQRENGHYLPELINNIIKAPLNANIITTVGDAFKKDWDVKELRKGAIMKNKLEELAEPLRETLNLIISTFTSKDHSLYNSFSLQDKQLLQLFFDTFKFLLSPLEIQQLTIIGLTGQEYPSDLKQTFFTPQVFSMLSDKPSSFDDKIHRDIFLTLPNETSDLEEMHKAARSQFFSWDFLYDFEGDNFDFQFETLKKDRIRGPRKQAKLRLLMYKIYLIARQNQELFPHDQNVSRQDILKKLFDFVLDNPDFDIPQTSSEEMTELPISKSTQLVDPSKFRKYYVPLLNLLCKKIKGCKLMSEKFKPIIVKNYENYGNFEALKKKKLEEGILPSELIDEINKQIEHNEFAKLDEKMDVLLSDDEESSEQDEKDTLPIELQDPELSVQKNVEEYEWEPKDMIFEEVTSAPAIIQTEEITVKKIKKNKPKAMSGFKAVSPAVVRSGSSKLMKKLKNKHVSAFEPLVSKFLPQNEDLTDKSVEFIDKFLDKIDSTDNVLKKNIMRSLLIKFVLTRRQVEKDSSVADKIIFNILNRMITKIRNSYSFNKTVGLKNFFMRTINSQVGLDLSNKSESEKNMYHNDIILFVYFACQDRYIRASKEVPARADLPEIAAQTKNTASVLNDYFFGSKNSKIPSKERGKILQNKILRNPVMMEKIPAYEFFTHFMDFFDYFKTIEPTAQSTYSDYGQIYMNFYSFLVTLRTDIFSHITDPHQFVLEKLESCLTFTETVENYNQNKFGPLCLMSHRKYAEMYYFYKTYLFSKDKLPGKQMTSYSGSTFDTHTRIFMNFALQSSVHLHALTDSCQVNMDTPACFTQKFFNILLNYIHQEQLTAEYVIDQIKQVWEPKVRFHLVAAVEAVFMNIKHGNVKDYEKVLRLDDLLDKNGIQLFHFDQEDVPELALYLKRTYRKRIFENFEIEATKVIQAILRLPQHKGEQDPLDQYFMFGGNVFLDYVKLFLLLSENNNDFLRIAQYIVDHRAGSSLLRMNTAEKHADYLSLIAQIGTEDANFHSKFRIVRTFMRTEYEKINQICMNDIHTFTVGSKTGDEDDYDPFEDIFNQTQSEEQQTIALEDQHFEEINKKLVGQAEKKKNLVYEQTYQVEMEEMESSIFNVDITGNEPVQLDTHREVSIQKDDDLNVEKTTKMYFNGKVVDKNVGIDLKERMTEKIGSMMSQKASKIEEKKNPQSPVLNASQMLGLLKNKDFLKKQSALVKKSTSKKFII